MAEPLTEEEITEIREALELHEMGCDDESALRLLATIEARDARIEELIADLAECFRLSGADPDGDEDWRIAPRAVAEVRRLREESDADGTRIEELEARISDERLREVAVAIRKRLS